MPSRVPSKCSFYVLDLSGHSEVFNNNTFLLFASLTCMFSYTNTYKRLLKFSINQPMLVKVKFLLVIFLGGSLLWPSPQKRSALQLLKPCYYLTFYLHLHLCLYIPMLVCWKKKEGKKEHRKEEEKNRFKGRKLQSFPPYNLHLFLLLVLRDQILGPAFGSCQSHASL